MPIDPPPRPGDPARRTGPLPDDPRDRPAAPPAPVALRSGASVRATVPTRAELASGPTTVTVVAWEDPLLDRFGHDPRSPYVERFWLGVLGPSATWLLRSLAHRFDLEPDGYDLDLRDTARSLGIGSRAGANGALYRTLERVMAFGFARFTDETTLAVRRRMGPLNRRQQQRLPESLQREHDDWLAAHTPAEPSATDLRRRARALALSLIELGEDVEATEAQLHRWRFHPAIAFDSAHWAVEVQRHRRAQLDAAPPEPRELAARWTPADDRAPAGGDAA